MIWLDTLFRSRRLDEAVAGVVSLPGSLRPTHFSEEEGIRSAEDRLSDRDAFDRFVNSHPEGFYLIGDGLLYDVSSANKDGLASVVLYAERVLTSGDAESIFRALATIEPVFGCAASEHEYRHRNKVIKESDGQALEAWVGRDAESYVPGLYWLTLLSRSHSRQVGLDLDALIREDGLRSKALTDDLVLVETCESANDWESCAARIDALCERHAGIFSKRLVARDVKTARGLLDLRSILSRWK